jgi:hypothetical protein
LKESIGFFVPGAPPHIHASRDETRDCYLLLAFALFPEGEGGRGEVPLVSPRVHSCVYVGCGGVFGIPFSLIGMEPITNAIETIFFS